ncbi:hypothetical protein AAIR98_000183 [Elusimicrobium simillimum]|uniref:hypothetical protein n=1 Tax=Elusimicrobium simillimum TaxID=3143438 RepID=UPI003C700B6D
MKKYLLILLFLLFSIPLFCKDAADKRYATFSINAPYSAAIYRIDAAPEKGFNYPYFLMVPDNINKSIKKTLLVETNNTSVRDRDFAEEESITLSRMGESRYIVVKELDTPFLMPVFPRPGYAYTHALSREAILIEAGPLQRLDLQLSAMIKDARKRLKKMSIRTSKQVFIMGNSASCQFANRFVLLHPKLIAAAVCGNTSVLTMPFEEFGGVALPYAAGVADLKGITGKNFDLKNYQKVPQFFYRGDVDDNETLNYKDCFSEVEKTAVMQTFGSDTNTRWIKYKEVLESFSPNVKVTIYPGLDHSSKDDEAVKFFKSVLDGKN